MPATLRFHHLPAFLAALTAFGVLLALAGTTLWQRWLPAALWHLVFAVGALPLILAAMAYFTPVLTRTPETPRALVALPLLALAAGLTIVAWFVVGSLPLREIAPWLALGAPLGLLVWMRRRQRACLGPPHACLAWYRAALLCLSLGLLAVGLSALAPAYAEPLRAFHLHINTLGFMGLTAIGTLQVLLPTVLGHPDPAAPRRLGRDLPWSLGGALGIAGGVAIGGSFGWPLAIVATLAYGWPLLRLGNDIRREFGAQIWSAQQAAPLLLAAMAGLAATLLHGLAHGAELVRARDALPLFVIGFLLPLVSGAVSQLLPVWLRPGAQAGWHRGQRAGLAACAGGRAILLLAGGALAALGKQNTGSIGYLLGGIGAAWLIVTLAWAVWQGFKAPH